MKFLFNNVTGQSIPIKPKPKNENKLFLNSISDLNNFKRDIQIISEKKKYNKPVIIRSCVNIDSNSDITKNENKLNEAFTRDSKNVNSDLDIFSDKSFPKFTNFSSPEKIPVNKNPNIDYTQDNFDNEVNNLYKFTKLKAPIQMASEDLNSLVDDHQTNKKFQGLSGEITHNIATPRAELETVYNQPVRNHHHNNFSRHSMNLPNVEETKEKMFLSHIQPKGGQVKVLHNLQQPSVSQSPSYQEQGLLRGAEIKEKIIVEKNNNSNLNLKENLFKDFQEIDDIFKNKKENDNSSIIKDKWLSCNEINGHKSNLISSFAVSPDSICRNVEDDYNLSQNLLVSGMTDEHIIQKDDYQSKNSIKNITYGIKKTTNCDINFLNKSMNCNYFKIGLNNGTFYKTTCSDCLYLFPYISEINKENIDSTNEKKIESFRNKNNIDDIQYFPLDYISCGNIIPLSGFRNPEKLHNQIRIFNIYWNIIQSINNNIYNNNEILCFVPNISDYNLKNIKLQINFEIHNQISGMIEEKFKNNILPYKNNNITNLNPANTCLTKVESIIIEYVNGYIENDIIIELPEGLDLNSVLLCAKISIPNESFHILNGYDKNNMLSHGYVPFSQFLLQFDYQ